MPETVKVCTDRVLPREKQWEATEKALSEREGNALGQSPLGDSVARLEALAGSQATKREALVMFASKRWQTGRTLKFHFLDGPDWAREKAYSLFCRWLDVANLEFTRTRDRAASDIRVTFEPGGSWSYLGTDTLAIPKDEPTMQLGWLLDSPDDFEEWRRVCLHEMGHALDFGHEQAHPEGDISWNRPVVYDYYGGPPNNWSKEQVDAQVFRKYAGAPVTNFSAYDKESIMHYAIPERFVLDPKDAVGWNTSRSQRDRRYAGLWYPKPDMEAAITAALDVMARDAQRALEEGK